MRTRSLILCALLLTGPAHAQAPQQRLTNTLQTLAKTRETEDQLKKRLLATEQEMQDLRERVANLAEQLQSSEQRVSNEEDALAKANSDYAQKRREFEERKADYTTTVLSLLRMRNLPPSAMFSSNIDTQQLLRTASALEKTNEAVAIKAAQLRDDMAQIKQLQSTVKTRGASTRAEQDKLELERRKLAKELVGRQKLQAELSADHARAEAKVAELSRTSKSLQELIRKLADNEKAQAKIDPNPIKKTSLRDFGDTKGSLRTPVAGQVIHRFGDKQNANGTYRGMVLKARPNATVVAPYDGEIAYTGPFRDYGNMVLIKHKNGYISLIAGLGKVSASLNQAAIRGEPIGAMPADGSGQVYVELRDRDAKPIDPAEWFANVVTKSAQR